MPVGQEGVLSTMNELLIWFRGLDPAAQVFWGCALVSSTIFLIQAILTMIGMDHDMDFDVGDFNADTMDTGGAVSLFSIRSLVNFFVGFGWTGVSFYDDINSKAVLYLLAICVGGLFSYATIFLIKKLKKLEHNGAYKIADCVGKTCDVYLRIPAVGEGRGKVQISLNGSIHEFDAVSTGEAIATGKRVKVVAVEGTVLKVE